MAFVGINGTHLFRDTSKHFYYYYYKLLNINMHVRTHQHTQFYTQLNKKQTTIKKPVLATKIYTYKLLNPNNLYD